ncbi:ribokinase [Izhakiella australiensis]|uniref:Ribokinase n=1 Tax=Izhakiella australiensis TaxID=1926881 RepID=A0A1S8YS59_9GAMM|nr:ribokinase [Izhakiella australiensis]OON41652.1 ribokinase [Izhakiella australiensis]
MHIFVVGNIAVDETWTIDDLPEKGSSIFGNKTSQQPGGKGANQAVIFSRCKIPTTLIAATGNDHYGEWLHRLLNSQPDLYFPLLQQPCHTDTSIILNSQDGDNTIITATDAASALTLEVISQQLTLAKPGDLLVQQGNFSLEKTAAIFRLAREKGLITAFNPSPVRREFTTLWPLVDIVVLNHLEAELLQPPAELPCVITTQGAAGTQMTSFGRDYFCPAVMAQVVDTTGAGDTFLAVALASALRRGGNPDLLALQHASRAAAITITERGTWNAFPNADVLQSLLMQNA